MESNLNKEIQQIKLKLDIILKYLNEEKQKKKFLINDYQTEIFIKNILKKYFTKKLSKL